MSTYADRLASFTTEWPHTSPAPEDLARAGWIFEPEDEYPDNVACEECERCLFNWKPGCNLKVLYIGHLKSCRRYSKLAFVQDPVASPPKNSQASAQIASLQIAPQKAPQASPIPKPSLKDIGFLDLSLQHDFPELCLFHNVDIFCDRIERCISESEFLGTDILELLPKCLRGEALKWFSQSNHQDLAVCIRAMRARFEQASQKSPLEAPPKARQAPPQAPPEVPPEAPPRAPDYHHCKLCNASFSSMARLIRYTQENVCSKPSCRHCEIVFSSKNRLHHHLREGCQKRMHRQPSSSPSPPPRTATPPEENRALPPSPSPSLSPLPIYRAISPPPPIYQNYLTVDDLYARYAAPPYLKMDDLFRMFGGRSATTKSSTITMTIDDPFARPFVLPKKSMESIREWQLGVATSYHQFLRALCFPPRIATGHRCRPPLLDINKWQAIPIWV